MAAPRAGEPPGGLELNPDAADFIPREMQETQKNKNPGAFSRNNNTNQPSRQQPFRSYRCGLTHKREYYQQSRNHYEEDPPPNPRTGSEGHRTNHNNKAGMHSFQNQRRHRMREDKSCSGETWLAEESQQETVGNFVQPSLLEKDVIQKDPMEAGAELVEHRKIENLEQENWRAPDSRGGAKPKKINLHVHKPDRGVANQGRLSFEKDNRTFGKKSNEMTENLSPPEAGQTETLNEPAGMDKNGEKYNDESQRKFPKSKNSQRGFTWGKEYSDDEVYRSHNADNVRKGSSFSMTASELDAKADLNEERANPKLRDRLSHRTQTWKVSEVERRRKRPQDLQKKSFDSGRKTSWKKQMEVHKSKETHTGSLIEHLTAEKYECMVCCEVIRVMVPVWSCQSCYHVFHLNCIKKWARSPASQAEDGNGGWRCPACQNVSVRVPNSYMCFCGKVNNPEWNRNEIPHSCGELCGKKRSGNDCPHSCNILCHPGPCPSCPAFVTKACECGRTSQSVRCGQPGTIHCNNVCDNLLNCGKHTCAQVCHAGKCQPCPLTVQQACYCGANFREVLCGTDKEEYDGIGYFSCQKPCDRKLNCGNHNCLQLCHPSACQPCPRLPKLVRSCPCGQTPLCKLLELGYPERRNCTESIPSCGKTCGKPLPCGSDDSIHTCSNLCHEGECGPCAGTSTVNCRCGFKKKDVPCVNITKEDLLFLCDKRCNKKRSCGRHKCNEVCCVDTKHKCRLLCGRKLNCGQHKCEEPCHRGNCQNCWQSSFDELTCHCGVSVIYPPVPCGTRPPECKNPCTREHECDHPVFHNCHSEEKCPPCTYLTQKWCMGKHEPRNNIPCHLTGISCGLACNKLLPCGMHKCKKICHKGDCVTEEQCKQLCIIPRPDCNHPCSSPCHPDSPCPKTPCNAEVILHCGCQRRKEIMICSEASSNYQRITAIAMASKLSDMHLGDSVEISRFISKKEMKQTRLECDQECATLERNRRVAVALNINPASDPFHTRGLGSKYSDSLKEDARKDLKFVTEVEEEMKALVEAVNKGKQQKKSRCYPPMNREHRRIIHELAEVYGVESISYDSEPKRNVVITAVKGKSVCPNTSLTSLIEREMATRPPPPIAHYRQQALKIDNGTVALQKPFKEEPIIDYFDVQD